MAKLTRDQIAKGLDTIPMSQILIGATGTLPKLSNKQIAFAKQVAMGTGTQADAYRDVYQSKGRPKTVGSNASKLATDSRIATVIESFKTAQAYAEYQTPVQLRALVVSQLTKHVLDEEFPPAQRVACLKLLGSVAEIGLFVDRKETLVIHKSDDVKARLLDQLRTITGQATEVQDDADSLLDEIKQSPDADPTHPGPPVSAVCDVGDYIHTIPLEQLSENSIPKSGELLPSDKLDENVSG